MIFFLLLSIRNSHSPPSYIIIPSPMKEKEKKENTTKADIQKADDRKAEGQQPPRGIPSRAQLTLLCLVRLAPISRRFFVASRTFRRGVPSPPGHSRPEGAEGLTPPAVPQRCTRAATLPIGPSTSPLRSRNVPPLHETPPPLPPLQPPPPPPPPPPLTQFVITPVSSLLPSRSSFLTALKPPRMTPLSLSSSQHPPPPFTSSVSTLPASSFASSATSATLSPVTFADDPRPTDPRSPPPPLGVPPRSCLEIVAAATQPADRPTSCRSDYRSRNFFLHLGSSRSFLEGEIS